jgi:hypothetical protein
MVIKGQQFSIDQVKQGLGGVLGHDLHAKRVGSLYDATLGVLRTASLAVCTCDAARAILQARPGLHLVELEQPRIGWMCNTLSNPTSGVIGYG